MPGIAIVALLGLATTASTSVREQVPKAATRSVIVFQDSLGFPQIRLKGRLDSQRVWFGCEERWDLLAGSEAHLFLEHAPEVDPNRSFLSVTLNGGILRSLRLDATNQNPLEIVIPLPPPMLHRSNELVLSVEQPPTVAEEAQKVWTVVAGKSYLVIEHLPKPVRGNLRDLPAPLLDPFAYRPLVLSALVPAKLSPATAEALGLLVAGLSSRVAPREVKFEAERSLAEAGAPLLIVGTPAEQPGLGPLLKAAGFVVEDSGKAPRLVRATGAALDPSVGVAALTEFGSSSRPLLVVTAGASESLPRAVRALLDGVGLGGSASVLLASPPRADIPPREWKGYAPPRTRFALSDLGYKEGDLNLAANRPLNLAVRLTPDARSLGDALEVTLDVRLSAAAPATTRLAVQWNGVILEWVSAAQLKPPVSSVSVSIPTGLVKHENHLVLLWKSDGADPLASVLPSSTLYLPRSYSAKLPDLGLFHSALYPLSLRADLSDVVALVPAASSEDTVSLVCALGAILGRFAPAERLSFRVRLPGGLTVAERAASHLLLLETEDGPHLVAPPALDWQRLPNSRTLREQPVLEELASPWNPTKWVVRLQASGPAALLRGLERLQDASVLAHLAGDTAFLGPEAPTCYLVGKQRLVEETSYLSVFEAWLQSHWLALPLIVGAVSLALSLAVRPILAHYRALRTSAVPQ